MKYLLPLIIFIIISGIGFFIFTGSGSKMPRVLINGIKFNAEIAQSEDQKEIGLAKYKKISNNFALVFPFPKADYYTFWMKNMNFPIDIIFIKNNKIVDIFKNVPAPKPNTQLVDLPRYQTHTPADTVIEINAGLFDKYKFKKGNSVKIIE